MRRLFVYSVSILIFLHAFGMMAFANVIVPSGLGYSEFRTMYSTDVVDSEVPVLVSVFIPGEQDYPVVVFDDTGVVFDEDTGGISPHRFVEKSERKTVIFKVTDSSPSSGIDNILDGDFDTSGYFDLDKDDGKAFVLLESEVPVTSYSLNLLLDKFVTLPSEVAISAEVGGELKTIVARKKIDDRYISFPQTTAKKWRVEMWHSQPFGLNELVLSDKNAKTENVGSEIVWLAMMGHKYIIFADAEAYTKREIGESGNLFPKKDEVIRDLAVTSAPNPYFQEPDFDEDDVPDIYDNCVKIANTDQTDADENGLGDACEDFDRDGVINAEDNCPEIPNRYQRDIDADGIGDECDEEEGRITERLPFLPWLAMGTAALLILGMIVKTVRSSRKK